MQNLEFSIACGGDKFTFPYAQMSLSSTIPAPSTLPYLQNQFSQWILFPMKDFHDFF